MIVLNVFYQTKPGLRKTFVEAVKARGILASIRAEAGCRGYEYFAALEYPDKLFLLEQWEDEAALARHGNSAGMAALGRLKQEYIQNTEVRRY